MITIEQTENLVNVAVMGEFTLADFKEFEEQSLYKLKFPGELDLLLDLRAMVSFSVDVALEDIKFFKREHDHDFTKIAIVTENPWLSWEALISRAFINADLRAFSDYDEAKAWVTE